MSPAASRAPNTETKLTPFAEDVLQGLTADPKRLSSKWFYDQIGDSLFQKIMASPEYYLTDKERAIFQNCAADFLAATDGTPFDLVELGAGDGTKTQYLIEHFQAKGADFRYLPIDISANALDGLGKLVKQRWPELPFFPVRGDYFLALDNLPGTASPRKKLVLFPGANIGNFHPADAAQFLSKLKGHLRPGDLLVIGFDLKKNPARILAAYNDAGGVTAAFNLNLLTRINRELGANFVLEKWMHWPIYDPMTGATRSFLVSCEEQQVYINALDREISFAAWEAIDMEVSQKYSFTDIESMAVATGYQFVRHVVDADHDFVDTIWRV